MDQHCGLSPHGESGLKCVAFAGQGDQAESLSTRREWVEIIQYQDEEKGLAVSLHTERVG